MKIDGPVVVSLCGAVLAFLLLGTPAIVARRKFVRTYPDRHFVAEKLYKSVSGSFGSAYYGGMLRIELNTQGIRISMPWPFHLLFSALVIPWNAVKQCRQIRRFFRDVIQLDVDHGPYPIFVGPFLWRDESTLSLIMSYWEKHHSARDAAQEASS